MIDVITIGSALQDIFLEVAEGRKISDSTDVAHRKFLGFALDSKIPAEELHRHLGGGGLNSAVVFKKLGLNPVPASKIGSDSWGQGILSRLRDLDIDTSSMLQDSEEPTGLSILLHDVGENEHLSFNYKGASNNLEVSNRQLPVSKWLYVSSLTGENWQDDMRAVTELSRDMSVAWNPGSAQIKSIDSLDEMLQNTEVLLLNLEEAGELLRSKGLQLSDDRRETLQMLADLGPRIVVVTEGVGGANVFADNTWLRAPIVQFDVKDTTGTGDTFGSTFVAGLIMEKDFSESLKMALTNSGAVTRSWGAQQGLMSLNELAGRLNDITITQL